MLALSAQLRTEADEWSAARQKWMNAKLRTGAHPDTDPRFWSGYASSEPPSLEVNWHNQGAQTERMIVGSLVMAALLFIGAPIALLLMFVGWKRRDRNKKAASI